eukprot:307839_1
MIALLMLLFINLFHIFHSVDIPDHHWIRIRTLSNNNHCNRTATWDHGNLTITAEFILSLITDLKPNVLERYFSGKFDPNATIIPTNNPNVNQSVIQFLQLSLDACSSTNCFITPRVSLKQYPNCSTYETTQFFYDLQLSPPLRILSIDNWEQFNENVNYNETLIKQVLNGFLEQGWEYLAINDNGGFYNSYGEGSLFEFGISPNTWQPKYNEYNNIIQKEENVMKILSYIDFPGAMKQFANLTGDEQANVLESIAQQSQTNNFTNVWMIFQGTWDSTKVFTSQNNSIWHGKSIYNVSKQLMNSYG